MDVINIFHFNILQIVKCGDDGDDGLDKVDEVIDMSLPPTSSMLYSRSISEPAAAAAVGLGVQGNPSSVMINNFLSDTSGTCSAMSQVSNCVYKRLMQTNKI